MTKKREDKYRTPVKALRVSRHDSKCGSTDNIMLKIKQIIVVDNNHSILKIVGESSFSGLYVSRVKIMFQWVAELLTLVRQKRLNLAGT